MMGWDDALKVVAALGGVSVIAGAVAAWIGNLVSSRVIERQKATLAEQLETHKDTLLREADRNRLLLKRQELMFEREIEASVAFLRLHSKVVPDAWAPDLDWLDAQTRIAEELCSHESDLKKLLEKHSIAFSKDARKLICAARSEAISGWFEVAQETTEGRYGLNYGPSDRVRKHVDEFYERMKEAEAQIRQDLKAGSFDA